MAVWTELKVKLITTINELKDIKAHGFKEVYGSNAAVQKIHITQESAESWAIRRAEQLERQLRIETGHYQEQLKVRLTEFTRLEQKLDRVRNLVADGEVKKLMALYKRGEI